MGGNESARKAQPQKNNEGKWAGNNEQWESSAR